MSNNNNNSTSNALNTLPVHLLTIAFVILKLTHYIDWSWVWVLSPLWISFAFALLIYVLALTVVGLSGK